MRQRSIDEVVLLSNQASLPLANKVASQLGIPVSDSGHDQFKNGEIIHQFRRVVLEGQQVVIIGSNHTDSSHMELLDLIDGAHQFNAESVNVVIPYLGYSTMERTSDEKREIIKGITRTRQIFRSNPTFVAFLDLHAEAVMHAHDARVKTRHMKTDDLVIEQLTKRGLDNLVLVSPDYGRSKWVKKIADRLGVTYTTADKDRMAQDQVALSQVADLVNGKNVVICDDMIRTGGTSAQAVTRCFEAGAKTVTFLATHLEMAADAEQKLRESNATQILGTDSHPNAVPYENGSDLIEVYSVAGLIAETIKKQLNLK